jgi:hypothetical protein
MVASLPHDIVKLQFVCKLLLICKFFYLMLLFIVIITCLLLTLPMLYSNIDTIIPTCFVLTPIDSTICTFNVFNPNVSNRPANMQLKKTSHSKTKTWKRNLSSNKTLTCHLQNQLKTLSSTHVDHWQKWYPSSLRDSMWRHLLVLGDSFF